MVCAYDGKSPWARYTSTDPKLMEWKLAEHNFTSPPTGSLAGALFHKVRFLEPIDRPANVDVRVVWRFLTLSILFQVYHNPLLDLCNRNPPGLTASLRRCPGQRTSS